MLTNLPQIIQTLEFIKLIKNTICTKFEENSYFM